MELTVLFVVAVAILGIINALIQVVKTSFKLANQYVPIVSVEVGILIGIAVQPVTSVANEVAYHNRNDNQVSYHVAIDDKEVIQCVPFNKAAWYCGDGANGIGKPEIDRY